MKFKAIFYPIFCFAITISLAIFLVVKNNIDKAHNGTSSSVTTPVKSDDNTEDSNHDDEISIISDDPTSDDPSDNPTDDDNDNKDDNPIAPTNEIEIVLVNFNSNCITTNGELLCLNYLVLCNNQQYANQEVNVVMPKNTIAKVISNNAPMIYIQKINKGKVNITIELASNPSIFRTISIEFC